MSDPDTFGEDMVYDTAGMTARLNCHDTANPEWVSAFVTAVGGTLRPQEGGCWQRVKMASHWLRPQEAPASAKSKARVLDAYRRLEVEDRSLVRGYGEAAGIGARPDSTLLTEGELAYYDWAVAKVAVAAAEGAYETVVAAFHLTDEEATPIPEEAVFGSAAPDLGTDGAGGTRTPAPSEKRSTPKRTDIVIDGVQFPEGYTDDVPDGMTVAETKELVNQFIHKVLIAEVEGKKRKGLVDWLTKKCTFKVPDEWRVDAEETAA